MAYYFVDSQCLKTQKEKYEYIARELQKACEGVENVTQKLGKIGSGDSGLRSTLRNCSTNISASKIQMDSLNKNLDLITAKYEKTEKYNTDLINQKIMGPNPLKLEEELMKDNSIKKGSIVMDLGSGQGITSIFLVKEYGFKVYATDLWSNPEENKKFFTEMGLTEEQIIPVKADATELKYEKEFFDAVVSTDSYNYFGRDENYLDEKLLPFIKSGGYIYIVVPGMKKDCHNDIPKELLLSWTPEQLDYIHDMEYWKNIVSKSKDSEIVSIYEMESNEECWNDWIKCDNEYSKNDKKAIDAGACKYLNFIAIVLKKK